MSRPCEKNVLTGRHWKIAQNHPDPPRNHTQWIRHTKSKINQVFLLFLNFQLIGVPVINATFSFLFHSQTMALWLKNTDFPTKHAFCFYALKQAISSYNSKLLQNKTVRELLWGYEDPLLKFVYNARKLCPIPDGLNPFVQLQVGKIIYRWCKVRIGIMLKQYIEF